MRKGRRVGVEEDFDGRMLAWGRKRNVISGHCFFCVRVFFSWNASNDGGKEKKRGGKK